MTGPPDRDPARPVADLAATLLSGKSFSDLLDLVVNLAVSAVDGVTGASVSCAHDGGARFTTTNASSEAVHHVDKAQYDDGKGPCVETIRTSTETMVVIPFEQWPHFSDQASAAGVRSVHSLPLTVDGRTIGALNLYSTTHEALSANGLRVAREFAAQAAVVLANAIALTFSQMTSRQLQDALESRDLIGQAKGILMARQDIDADAAFDVLRRASQRTNRKLRDIAADIVSSHPGPRTEP